MSALQHQLRQHKLAMPLFVIYVVGWLGALWLTQGASNPRLDACGRGTLLFYPIILGVMASLPYWLTILLLALFNKAQAGFFWMLLGAAVLWPILLLAVRW